MGMNFYGETSGKFFLSGPEDKTFSIIKTRTDASCLMCKQQIPSKSYCLGGGYTKICINCSEAYIKNFLESLKDYEKQAEGLVASLKSQGQKIAKNNILAKVEFNTHQSGGLL